MSKKKLHIGVNGRFLEKPYTGIGQYTRHLFWSLAKQHPEIQLLIVSPETINIDHPSNIEIKIIPEIPTGTASIKKVYWERIQLTKYLKKQAVDIIHHPYPTFFGTSIKKQPIILTVHDDIPWAMPAYQRSFFSKFYQKVVKKKAQRASKILTVSETSRKDIARSCQIPIENIQVIPIAPGYDFYHKNEKSKEILAKYNISDSTPYLLYNGGYDIRKNVSRLIKVFTEKIAPSFGVNLVMTGGKVLNNSLCDSYNDVLTAQLQLKKLRTKGQIITTGFITEKDLSTLHQQAYLFVNFSLKEGFNLPLVEAAISGTPMLISNIPVHHEVIGDYAAYSSPADENDMAQQLTSLLRNSEIWQQYKEKLSHYKCPFSWEESAEKLYETYKEAIGKNKI